MVKGVKDGTAAERRSRRTWRRTPGATGSRARRRSCATGPTPTRSGTRRPTIKGKFKITTLPGIDGKPGVGVLGGDPARDQRLHRQSRRLTGGGELLHLRGRAALIGEGSTPPVTKAAYQDPAVRKALGLPDEIERAIGAAKPRPVSPVYPQISQAIYKNVNQALAGSHRHGRRGQGDEQSDPEGARDLLSAARSPERRRPGPARRSRARDPSPSALPTEIEGLNRERAEGPVHRRHRRYQRRLLAPRRRARASSCYVLNRGATSIRPLPPEASGACAADVRDPESVARGARRPRVRRRRRTSSPSRRSTSRPTSTVRGRTGQYVFISSASAYQKPAARLPIVESTPLRNPFWPYSQRQDRLRGPARARVPRATASR